MLATIKYGYTDAVLAAMVRDTGRRANYEKRNTRVFAEWGDHWRWCSLIRCSRMAQRAMYSGGWCAFSSHVGVVMLLFYYLKSRTIATIENVLRERLTGGDCGDQMEGVWRRRIPKRISILASHRKFNASLVTASSR